MQPQAYYDQLPFTLPPEQTDPEYVIFGTGLQQCILAAYKTKMESKIGLILDNNKSYGSSLKTLSFKELYELDAKLAKQQMYQFVTSAEHIESNGRFYSECVEKKKHRGYSIDIEPSFFFANTITCECLKQADMDKYMDFHLVNNILYLENRQFIPVPLSKGKIFESKYLSLFEKKILLGSLHKLIKIYQKFMNLEEDFNSTKQFDKDFADIEQSLYEQFLGQLGNHFLIFVEKLVKKNKKIIDYLAYIICNLQYNYNNPIPAHAANSYTLRGFICKFGKFIKSCGVYGESPYLYVDNGIGDIPQAFSRVASVFGSLYILHPKISIESITQSQDQCYEIKTNLSPQRPIKTKQIFLGPTHLSLQKQKDNIDVETILRIILICSKTGKQESCPSIVSLHNLINFTNPVYLFIFDQSTSSCPVDCILYQFETIVAQNDQEISSKSQSLKLLLAEVRGQGFFEAILFQTTYIRTRKYPKEQSKDTNFVELQEGYGIELDQHFSNFIDVVGQKELYFKKQQNNDEEEPLGGYETNYLIQKLEGIDLQKLKSQDKQVETVSNQHHDSQQEPQQNLPNQGGNNQSQSQN